MEDGSQAASQEKQPAVTQASKAAACAIGQSAWVTLASSQCPKQATSQGLLKVACMNRIMHWNKRACFYQPAPRPASLAP
jgi:hypothetical protein